MTRKIIDVPWNVSTSLYEFLVSKCSCGVASWARMTRAMIPPPAKNTSAVAMYMIPIRLWSTVTSHFATRPLRHDTGYTASDLAATRACSLVDVRLRVPDERVHLLVVPAVADRRHCAAPVAHDRLETGGLREQDVAVQRRTVTALPLVAVARRADALVLGAAELRRRRVLAQRRPVARLVGDDDARVHLRVERPADQTAVTGVRAGLRRLEPRVVRAARDRLDLPLQLRHPEAVDDVVGLDGQPHVPADRHEEVVDRARPVRIVELPVELMSLDRDLERVRRLRRRRNPRQLDEDHGADDGEDDDRDHRPDQLEAR